MAAVADDLYARKRPPKGKPLPLEHLVRGNKGVQALKVCFAGPDFVGVSSVLQQLTRRDYQVVLGPALASHARTAFLESHFSSLVTAW